MSIHQEVHCVLDRSMQDITKRFAGIQLMKDDVGLSENVCTVHTVLEGEHRAALLLHADMALLVRLAQNVMKQETVTSQDIEDVATEYFNVLCGRVAAGFFQIAHIPSRFQTPRFRPGKFIPESKSSCRHILTYNSEKDGSMQLICVGLPPNDEKNSIMPC